VPVTTAPASTVPATTAPATTAPATTVPTDDSAIGDAWVRVQANLLVDSVDDVMTTIRAARAAGADTVLFADTKTSNFYVAEYRDRWLERALALRDAVRAEGMAFVATTASVGYCAPILQIDPSLANAMPITDAPYVVQGGTLVPEQTATLLNGSFESYTGNEPTDWQFQDAPGTATVIDTTEAADGSASMRFDGAAAAAGNGLARVSTTVAVQPFQQYVLKYRLKADSMAANFIGPVVRGEGTDITLTNQHPSLPADSGARTYYQGADGLTTDWVEMEIAFNSREFTSVSILLGMWSSESGTSWIDDVRVEAAPTLNLVRRDSLPVAMRTEDGAAVTEGVDVEPVSDPLMGNTAYQGYFDTYHDVPAITVADGSTLAEGERVLFSGWHAQLTGDAQVGCSWNDPRTFELIRETHRQVAEQIAPDGILIDVEETRTGGWEPTDEPYGTSGAAFAAHVQRVLTDATAVVGGTPLYMWNDMLDPTMNAVADYYQVKGSLDGSWVGVDPNLARIVNWRSGDELRVDGAAGVAHFADLGFEQIVAGFYDEDVADNHVAWTTATAGQPGIVGSMYTTWTDDFTQLEPFAALWWAE
jgi:hypothetical protein